MVEDAATTPTSAAALPLYTPTTPQIAAAVILFSVATSVQSVLIKASQNHDDGTYPFSYAELPLLAEIIKLAASFVTLYMTNKASAQTLLASPRWATLRLYAVPAALYSLQNNLQFPVLSNVDPLTFQLLSHTKIVATGLLFRVYPRRYLSTLQWWALAVVLSGIVTSQLSSCTGGVFMYDAHAYHLAIAMALTSALTGAYTEVVLRRNDEPRSVQDVQLYAFGVFFNAARAWFVRTQTWLTASTNPPPLLTEAPLSAWVIAFNMAILGLSVSWVMKHAATITKVYGNILASLCTLAMCNWYFDMAITLPLVLGIGTVCAGAALYYMSAEALLGSTPDVLEQVRKAQLDVAAPHEPSHTRASTHPSIVAAATPGAPRKAGVLSD